ncbi:MAG: hypothetical protein JNK02_12750 [Planctomycetes bacterium]|nr:hypothetical protein [Planctomycetota bacterium]
MTHAMERGASWTAAEGRGAFGGFVGPRNLVDLVRSSAPWLFDGTHPSSARVPAPGPGRLVELGAHPLGWWTILLGSERLAAAERPDPAQITDYFALACAAHFASVATYVPTDVDAKIRRALWIDQRDPDELARMHAFALDLGSWDVSGVSARIVEVEGLGPVSGHDGERLSVLAGGLIGAWHAGVAQARSEFEAAIDAELERQARAFLALEAQPGRELELLRLSAVLTHNQGDVVQSLGTREAGCVPPAVRARFCGLARERHERYRGAFWRAARLYQALLAAEGHRHYPLREIRLLRGSPALLLPIGPCLDDWGATLARHAPWSAAERAEVAAGLLEGCRRVAGQQGYYRALAGFDAAHPGGIAVLETHFGSAARRVWRDGATRTQLAVRRVSFESSLSKRARQVLAAS